jgi:hypothetical protein
VVSRLAAALHEIEGIASNEIVIRCGGLGDGSTGHMRRDRGRLPLRRWCSVELTDTPGEAVLLKATGAWEPLQLSPKVWGQQEPERPGA